MIVQMNLLEGEEIYTFISPLDRRKQFLPDQVLLKEILGLERNSGFRVEKRIGLKDKSKLYIKITIYS